MDRRPFSVREYEKSEYGYNCKDVSVFRLDKSFYVSQTKILVFNLLTGR